jgi:nitroreductase/NAD-dependent dihydropyrimidine dehydrogenase PreA subunit
MALLEVDASKCKKDGVCVAVCPTGCLAADPDGAPIVTDPAMCIACGHCVAVCPHGALANARVAALGEAIRPKVRSWPAPEVVDGLLRGRRSIRVYADKPVTRELLADLLDVARFAPTASNVQEVRWIMTDSPQKVHELAGLTASWFAGQGTRPKYSAMWEQGHDAFLRGAPALAVAYAKEDAAWGAVDCAIALTFLELAAVPRGLGACWAGLLTHAARFDDRLRAALGLPEGHAVHGGLMLGYPKVRYAAVPPRNPVQVRWL